MLLLNKALLCKWNWHYAEDRGALWKQVISGKYGERGWIFCEVREKYGVGLWKAIRNNWDILSYNMLWVMEGE